MEFSGQEKGWEKFRTLTETDKNLTSVWEKSNSGITDTYGKWSHYMNKILHICFRKRRVRNKPRPCNREIRSLLKDKQNLKKNVSLIPEGREKLVLLEQLNKLSKRIKCKIGVFHFNLMSRNLDKNGKMSRQKFWKVKKKLFPRLNVPHAVIDNSGNEVTDPFNIKTLYQSEFEYCLRKRNIKAKLKEHESAVNELCNTRPENARCNTSSNYQVEEVQTAIKELKLGKSADPTGLIREAFIRGGSGLVHSITAVFNAFKKNFDVPSQWDDSLITTMFKKKGSWKKLDNYQGIFIVTILQLIYEKVLKNRISGVRQKNMSKFQNGGVKGKSVTDNLFILKGIIDH